MPIFVIFQETNAKATRIWYKFDTLKRGNLVIFSERERDNIKAKHFSFHSCVFCFRNCSSLTHTERETWRGGSRRSRPRRRMRSAIRRIKVRSWKLVQLLSRLFVLFARYVIFSSLCSSFPSSVIPYHRKGESSLCDRLVIDRWPFYWNNFFLFNFLISSTLHSGIRRSRLVCWYGFVLQIFNWLRMFYWCLFGWCTA